MRIVDMPVKVLNKDCFHCPELSIEVVQTTLYHENELFVENILYCEHWKRCAMVEERVMNSLKEGEKHAT